MICDIILSVYSEISLSSVEHLCRITFCNFFIASPLYMLVYGTQEKYTTAKK